MNGRNPLSVALDNSTSFKYKSSLLGKATDSDGNDRSLERPLINCKIHLELNWNNNCVMYGADTYAGGDVFRSLEMPLINCKIHLELNWNNNCVMYGADT